MKTALVFSGGGLFGAYQAGVWEVLSEWLDPDLIVGVSVGALNGWAVAGGISGKELINSWSDGTPAGIQMFKPCLLPGPALFAPDGVAALATDLTAKWQPRKHFAVVALTWPALRPRVFENGQISTRELLASCALPGLFPPVNLDGTYFCDGGVIGSLPLWAAWRLGADRVIGVNPMHHHPSRVACRALGLLRAWRSPRDAGSPARPAVVIHPPGPLGRIRDLAVWNSALARQWIEAGRRDALASRQKIADMLI